jgi:hypothetical protein
MEDCLCLNFTNQSEDVKYYTYLYLHIFVAIITSTIIFHQIYLIFWYHENYKAYLQILNRCAIWKRQYFKYDDSINYFHLLKIIRLVKTHNKTNYYAILSNYKTYLQRWINLFKITNSCPFKLKENFKTYEEFEKKYTDLSSIIPYSIKNNYLYDHLLGYDINEIILEKQNELTIIQEIKDLCKTAWNL